MSSAASISFNVFSHFPTWRDIQDIIRWLAPAAWTEWVIGAAQNVPM